MFVNVTPLLITISRRINFARSEHIPTRMDKQLSKSSKQVIKIYFRSVMIVKTVLMDTELENNIDKLM